MALPPKIAAPRQLTPIPVANGSNQISRFLSATSAPAPVGGNEGSRAVTDTQQATVFIPAGQSLTVALSGISFYFPSIKSVLGIQARPINAGQSRSFVTYNQGTGLRLGTFGFQRVELVNPDPVNSNTVTIIVGGGVPNNSYDEFIDKRVIITNNPASNVLIQNGVLFSVGFATRNGAWADSLNAGASQQVTDGYNGKNRKSIIFSNDDAQAVLQVLDSTGSIIGTVQPSTAWTTDTGGTLSLKNPSGGAVTCHIGEVYYN